MEKTPLDVRFWSKVLVSSPEACWVWTGYKNKKGYGRIFLSGSKYTNSNRCSWELHFGAIPDGLCVCHTCDNPSCVNPSHLFLGTHLDNMRDMFSKGRRTAWNTKKKVCPKCGGDFKIQPGKCRVCIPCRNTKRHQTYLETGK